MRILKNEPVVTRLSENLVTSELSNVAMVLQTPTLLATWYTVNATLTTTLPGLRNITDYVGPKSEVVYDKIENMPVCGVDNLVTEAQFDDDEGHTEDFQSSGVLYPNTTTPIPGSLFTINNSPVTGLYIVTDVKPCTVRSNSFTEFTFRLFSRNPEIIEQLEKQVKDHYTVAMSAIGYDKSLIIEKTAFESIGDHVNSYLEMIYLYQMLFYNNDIAAFVFEGIPDPKTNRRRATFVDMTLWKFMFDNGIIIFDSIITFASNTLGKSIDRIYTSCPDIYIDEYAFRRSIISRLYNRERKENFDKYRFPKIWEPTPKITKYQGLDIWYMEEYFDAPAGDEVDGIFYIWDDDFLCKIRNNQLYEEVKLNSGICYGCSNHCSGKPVTCYNPFLRNIIIRWFNDDGGVDWNDVWSKLQITDDRTIENYYLLPLVLGIYKQYIQGLQS